MSIKSKKERREKFTNIIGEYSVEILSECIRILKKSIDIIFTINYQNCYKNNNMIV